MSEIERELESELHRVLDPLSALPIPSRRSLAARNAARTLLGGAGAALGVKLLTGVAVAAAAVTVAGAATTGSINPVDWGRQVTQHVSDCKAALTQGQRGIGGCVSTFASQHGQAAASEARHNGNGNANGKSNGNGNANSHGSNPNANDHAKDKTKHSPSVKGEPTDPAATPPVKASPQP